MKNKITKKNSVINEQIDSKYKKANMEFRQLLKNRPDLLTAEPMEIYYWVEKLVNLTKIK